MEMRTLHCKAGNHEWQRPAQKGRVPVDCPEHKTVVELKPKKIKKVKTQKMSGLEKAQAARRDQRMQKEKEWAKRVENVINDPRMTYSMPKWGDSRQTTVTKLRYIQDQLQNHRKNREKHEIADLEKMREKIMNDPFSRTGHLL
jgi:hypothetical protein